MLRPPGNLGEMFSDPDEARFMIPLVKGQVDYQFLRTYADFLEQRQDPRGEWLQLHLLLTNPSQQAQDTEAYRTRYRELLDRLEPTWGGRRMQWLEIVKQTARLLNCGAGAAAPALVRFAFECPNQWETLEPTDAPGIRFCAGCRRKVYFCNSAAMAEELAQHGECIAVSRAVAGPVFAELSRNVVGQPEVGSLWAKKLFRDREGRNGGS